MTCIGWCRLGKWRSGGVPKGYVPVVVARTDGGADEERILIRVSQLKDGRISALLEMAREEFGYEQQGVLRIPCDPQRFKQIVSELSKINA